MLGAPDAVSVFCVLPPPPSHILSLSIWTVVSGLMNELQPWLPSDFRCVTVQEVVYEAPFYANNGYLQGNRFIGINYFS